MGLLPISFSESSFPAWKGLPLPPHTVPGSHPAAEVVQLCSLTHFCFPERQIADPEKEKAFE